MKKFEEEFGAYGHALTADEEMHSGNDYSAYERALDDDMANDTGKVWGLPPLEKWQNVDNLFKLVKQAERRIEKFNSTEYRYLPGPATFRKSTAFPCFTDNNKREADFHVV